MKLVDPGAATFELTVVRYQFPELTEYWDANWLMMRGVVEHPAGSWNFVDPCMTTTELGTLARWFDSLAVPSSSRTPCIFTEPNLAFELVSDPDPAIAVRFSFESAPSWIRDRNSRLDGVVLRFPLDANDPSRAASDLQAELKRFPVRVAEDA